MVKNLPLNGAYLGLTVSLLLPPPLHVLKDGSEAIHISGVCQWMLETSAHSTISLATFHFVCEVHLSQMFSPSTVNLCDGRAFSEAIGESHNKVPDLQRKSPTSNIEHVWFLLPTVRKHKL